MTTLTRQVDNDGSPYLADKAGAMVRLLFSVPDSASGQRLNLSGNYCGHDRELPRLDLYRPLLKGRHPAILVEAAQRLDRYYASPRQFLPSLEAANGSDRLTRSEAREADVLMGKALLAYLDLATGQIGIPGRKGVSPLSVPVLGNRAGLGEKRAWRALQRLRKAGLVEITEQRECREGEWVSGPAIKRVSPLLFAALGLDRSLTRETEKARKRRSKQQKQWAREAANDTPTAGARDALVRAAALLKLQQGINTAVTGNEHCHTDTLPHSHHQTHSKDPPDTA